jgi:4-hydroxy-3-methylbut-2-enyl diphosphate reductase
MDIEIDPHAGFCFGVEKAIKKAEVYLAKSNSLLCLGEIVHNPNETERLSGIGLKTIGPNEFRELKNTTVLIRAHGEPPETYEVARKNNIDLIEATCPVVIKLQKRVHEAWKEMKEKQGMVLIAGKRNHPEVNGLAGQTAYEAVIIESVEELDNINIKGPVRLFAQTTFNKEEFEQIRDRMKARMGQDGTNADNFNSHNSICGQVSNRVPKIKEFSRNHEVIIFVSGKNSSNGKYLFDQCKTTNPRSYFISSPVELERSWTSGAQSVGISGATSTPRWLMEEVAKKIGEQQHVS